MLKLQKDAVVSLFQNLGWKGVDGWTMKRLSDKLAGLEEMVDDEVIEGLESPDDAKLLKSILKAKGEVEIVEDGEAAPAKADKKKTKKAAKAEEPEEDDGDEEPEEDENADDEEESEDGDEEESEEEEEEKPAPKAKKDKKADKKDKKPAPKAEAKEEETEDEESEEDNVPVKKKAPPKKAGGDKGPGVIGSIVEFLKGASEDKPISKDSICKKLAKRFPDRDPDAMMKTINVQVPNRIKNDKKLDVQKNDKGYWIAGDAE